MGDGDSCEMLSSCFSVVPSRVTRILLPAFMSARGRWRTAVLPDDYLGRLAPAARAAHYTFAEAGPGLPHTTVGWARTGSAGSPLQAPVEMPIRAAPAS